MTPPRDHRAKLLLDDATRHLVRVAAATCAGSEARVRTELSAALGASVDPLWVEEVILQAYLFAGFPRALNAAREWRRVSGRPAPTVDPDPAHADAAAWRARGEATCAVVYGPFYDKLRHNIRALHPALDSWMIVEGYGKVLARPGLDLGRRELCVVASCAAQGQDRQLHSHLHGALHAGATAADVEGTLAAVTDFLGGDDVQRYSLLWARVRAMAVGESTH
ncbi:MAG: carboxymuconolactone decarboxylase family protein [Gemmatimonadetes bacterium]|nr:carboxymuconolactone decarboxylase family protein [Gemmatimonadota bacterium]